MRGYCRWLAVVALLAAMRTDAFAKANCWCKVVTDLGPALPTLSNVYIDYNSLESYDDIPFALGPHACLASCALKCADAARNDQRFKSAAFYCSKNLPSSGLYPQGVPISAYSSVGSWPFYNRALTAGILERWRPANVCTCPKGTRGDKWVDGGVTTDGKCVWVAGDHMKAFPGTSLPKDGNISGDANWFKYGEFIGQLVKPTCIGSANTPELCRWK